MFNPSRLKAQVSLRGGFAYANKYRVLFTKIPTGLHTDSTKLLQYTCENTSLPTRSIQASEKLIYGTSYQMPYKHAYGEISMTFYLTENMITKKAFDTWMNKIVDPITGDLGYYKDYTCDIKISKYRSTSEDVNTDSDYSVKLLKAWPSIVAEVAVSHSAGGEIAKLPVTFQYKKWVDSETAATGRPNPHDR